MKCEHCGRAEATHRCGVCEKRLCEPCALVGTCMMSGTHRPRKLPEADLLETVVAEHRLMRTALWEMIGALRKHDERSARAIASRTLSDVPERDEAGLLLAMGDGR